MSVLFTVYNPMLSFTNLPQGVLKYTILSILIHLKKKIKKKKKNINHGPAISKKLLYAHRTELLV